MNPLKRLLRINQKIDPELLEKRRASIVGFKTRMDLKRTPAEKFADFLTDIFGSVQFFIINGIWFLGWIIINSGIIPNIPVFDPYPFGFLTVIVSLEAIFLAIIVLISQNRAAKIADLREEIDLQINTLSEQEITKIINILDEIHDHLGLPSVDDDELKKMKEKTNIREIESKLIMETK